MAIGGRITELMKQYERVPFLLANRLARIVWNEWLWIICWL